MSTAPIKEINNDIKEWVHDVDKFFEKHVFQTNNSQNFSSSSSSSRRLSQYPTIHHHYHNDRWWGWGYSPYFLGGGGSSTVVNNYVGDSKTSPSSRSRRNSKDDDGFSTATKVALGVGAASMVIGGAAYLGSSYEYWCELSELISRFEKLFDTSDPLGVLFVANLEQKRKILMMTAVYNDLIHLRRMFLVAPATGAATALGGLGSLLTSSSSLLVLSGVGLTIGGAIGMFNYFNKDYSNKMTKARLEKMKSTCGQSTVHEDLIKMD